MTDESQSLLFIASDRREAEPWTSRWDNVRKPDLPVHWARAGMWHGRRVMAIANGVGAHRAVAAIEAAQGISTGFSGICSIGTGGALDPSLDIADVIVATAVTNGDQTWSAAQPGGPASPSGLIYSGSKIARTSIQKANLRGTGALLIEMEAAGVAATAAQLAVPFYCVRVVSDRADETFFIDFEKFLMSDGRFNVSILLMYALAHPLKGFPELLRLQRRTSGAAKQLGEFLANCSF